MRQQEARHHDSTGSSKLWIVLSFNIRNKPEQGLSHVLTDDGAMKNETRGDNRCSRTSITVRPDLASYEKKVSR
ncbi:hypothetical protein PoB_003351400 [Plakobranchus ocellatus]|uniref:Uncharacterized protein n=1 Tax=Plakobranchus ocellatus TaxID=259542 RepID=A0AAV4AH49_9GAST|nr:hypothetical protein PoB_003351400 [Plakobranchus ocellatus]